LALKGRSPLRSDLCVQRRASEGDTAAIFKLVAQEDGDSGKWFAELYLPEILGGPIARTRPIFNSMEQALGGGLRAMRKGLEQAGGLDGVPDFE